MFVSDRDFHINQEVIDNILTSDHAFIILSTYLNLDPKVEVESPNIYSTKTVDYNFIGASKDEWNSLIEKLRDTEQSEIVTNDRENCGSFFFLP